MKIIKKFGPPNVLFYDKNIIRVSSAPGYTIGLDTGKGTVHVLATYTGRKEVGELIYNSLKRHKKRILEIYNMEAT